jgi:carbon-monoxide dehydrogenase small subunit
MNVTLEINGMAREVEAQPWETLLEILRERLGLLGAKRGCNQGVCGACTVLIDGRPMRGCLSLAVNCTGREITTIEGLADGDTLAPVQQAFVDTGAVQCGFCIPGMLLTAHALLAETPNPSVEEVRAGLAGNLCRCSGYVKLIDAVRLAAAESGAG